MASMTGISISHGKKGFEKFARFGIISKGVVYCLMGILTVLTALGLHALKGSKTEAMQVIYRQHFGKFLLAVIGIGLLGYVALRFLQAFMDIGQRGKNLQALAIRAGFAISAFLYLGLSLYALKLSFTQHAATGSKQFLVGKVMTYPAGEWIIGLVAIIVVGSGIRQIYKGVSGRFMKNVHIRGSNYYNVFRKAGVVGYVARGIVFCILGYFLIMAASHSNPNEVKDTDGAFDFLQNTFGSVLMGLVAAGLVAYGIFMFVKAKHEPIEISTE
jgi:hypothetical protein